MTLDKKALDEIDARAKAATAGPWEYRRRGSINLNDRIEDYPDHVTCHHPEREDGLRVTNFVCSLESAVLQNAENSIFIAHARTDIPAMRELIEELASALDGVIVDHVDASAFYLDCHPDPTWDNEIVDKSKALLRRVRGE